PLDVRLEGRDRVAVGDPDDRLGRQVEGRGDLELAQGPLDRRLVADVAADDLHPVDQPGPHQLALGHPVAHQADHVRPGVEPAHPTPPRGRHAPARATSTRARAAPLPGAGGASQNPRLAATLSTAPRPAPRDRSGPCTPGTYPWRRRSPRGDSPPAPRPPPGAS